MKFTTNGKTAEVEATLPEKVFSTGSKGYFHSERVTIGNRTYLVNLQAVLKGSKPAE